MRAGGEAREEVGALHWKVLTARDCAQENSVEELCGWLGVCLCQQAGATIIWFYEKIIDSLIRIKLYNFTTI